MSYLPISTLKNIYKTGLNWSQPVVNQSQSELVRTSLVTAKNRKRPVYTGPVQFFGSLGISRTGLSFAPRLLRPKTETGLDFQMLLACSSLLGLDYELVSFFFSHQIFSLHGSPARSRGETA